VILAFGILDGDLPEVVVFVGDEADSDGGGSGVASPILKFPRSPPSGTVVVS
jgi:hypothetical protein